MKTVAVFALITLIACDGASGPPVVGDRPADQQARMDENQRAMRIEDGDIENYIARRGLQVQKSGTGLRVALLRDLPGPPARPDQWVKMNYRVELINGRECYSSEPGAPEGFRVEHDDVESGLHEGVQQLSPGDSAILIIPSHRAFGLLGDTKEIPPRSTVVYHIGLVEVSERPE